MKFSHLLTNINLVSLFNPYSGILAINSFTTESYMIKVLSKSQFINFNSLEKQPLLKEGIIIKSRWDSVSSFEVINDIYPLALKTNSEKTTREFFNDKNLTIKITSQQNNSLSVNIFAKKPQKKYQMIIESNEQISDETGFINETVSTKLLKFIKQDFYANQTEKRFIPAARFYSFLDTKCEGGKITENGMVWFRSSWGVYNGHDVDSSMDFNIRENNLQEAIFIQDRDNLPLKTRPRHIQVETLKPKKIGLLPLVQIHQPPIRNATWTTKQISFNDWSNYQTYVDEVQDLNLPEGHDAGLEWIKGLTSALGPIAALVGTILGGVLGVALAKKVILSIVAGGLLGGTSQIASSLIDILNESSVKDGVSSVKKIYELIMKNPIFISPKEIDFNNLKYPYITTSINGKLWGRANATSIWGITSKMNLNNVWGAMNSDISYRVYN